MPKFPGSAYQMSRYIRNRLWRGFEEYDSKEEAQRDAAILRDAGHKARVIVIPEGCRMNIFMAAPERYIIYVHSDANHNSLYKALIDKENSK